MDPKKQLVDRWLEKMEKISVNYLPILSHDELNKEILDTIASTMYGVLKQEGHEPPPNCDTKSIMDAFEKLHPGFSRDLLESQVRDRFYMRQKSLYEAYEKLKDTRRQENWATSWDHLKALLFRTATALMIALVVLFTGYVSKIYEIPVPMLRMIP